MENNLFYSNSKRHSQNQCSNMCFKKRKENTIASLYEVENFLFNYKHFIKYVKLYKLFRH